MIGGKPDTRHQILRIANELFAARGYAGTSLAHIAQRLNITKAALYYHFPSKSAILDALLAEPLSAYTRLAEKAAAATLTDTELLAAVIDTTAAGLAMVDLLNNDPSVRAQFDAESTRATSAWINETIVAALAGPAPSTAAVIRAHAAYTLAKHGTITWLATHNTPLEDTERAELLAAALRALDTDRT
jgi:AcrR family transcriptional regulator